MQNFMMTSKNGEKTIFGKKCHMTLRVKNFIEIALSHTVTKIHAFLHFMQTCRKVPRLGVFKSDLKIKVINLKFSTKTIYRSYVWYTLRLGCLTISKLQSKLCEKCKKFLPELQTQY